MATDTKPDRNPPHNLPLPRHPFTAAGKISDGIEIQVVKFPGDTDKAEMIAAYNVCAGATLTADETDAEVRERLVGEVKDFVHRQLFGLKYEQTKYAERLERMVLAVLGSAASKDTFDPVEAAKKILVQIDDSVHVV